MHGAQTKLADPRSSKSVVDVLVAARKLIEKEENWCTNAFYRNNNRSMCADAALYVACGAPRGEVFPPFYAGDLYQEADRALAAVMDDDVWIFNDRNSHAAVIAAFDRAIEVERAKATTDIEER